MTIVKVLGAGLLSALLLAACGGGGTNTLTQPTSGGSGGGGTGGGGTGGTATQIEMGATVGGTFNRGVIGTSLASGAQLAVGASTQLTVQFRNVSTGAAASDALNVTFTSSCAPGTTTITYAAGATSAATQNGTASATYTSTGSCAGPDTISATVASPPSTLVNSTASTSITLAQSQVGSIQFISATPANVGLQGTGRNETSVVTFKVVDQAGGPRPAATVNFTLDTSVGGITITPASATTGSDGTVTTTVKSGSVATSVRVTATTQGAGGATISTTSSQLTITTGIPVASRMSVAVQCQNVEAYDRDGVQVPVVVRLADRFGNPVPDGTAVQFRSSAGGSITGQCTTTSSQTESGFCNATWVSGGARSANGRTTILGTAIGEEDFGDVNNDGRFGVGDTFSVTAGRDGFTDRLKGDVPINDYGEPFVDANENGVYDNGESFLDFNRDGIRNPPNGKFDGLLCDDTARCGTSTTSIGASNVIISSTSSLNITTSPASTWDLKTSGTLSISVADLNGQPPASGTVIKLDASNGTAVGSQQCIVPCTTRQGPYVCQVARSPDGTASSSPAAITATTPGNIVNTITIQVAD